ncbi:MAG: protein kinase domain-containing protein [Acidobacteriota bacterium]
MIGTVIGHYRVVKSLGAGGMGEVFLVDDLKLHRRAALKLIRAELTQDAERKERFLQEATLAAAVDHPHITAVYDIDECDGRTFIAMEYVEGASLREQLTHGPLPLRRAIELALQVADALAKVHERGVIHRDLKPDNILVAGDGYAKIIDFGVAKLVDPVARAGLADAATMSEGHLRTADGVVLGTMGYMSPEQVRGAHIDARSDIFSFGALLYEMVAGTAPFRRGSPAEIMSAILTAPAAPVRIDDPQVEPDLQRILRKCLVKDAGGRYQSMRDVAVDLREVRESLTSGETAARRSGAVAPVPAGRWRIDRRTAIVAGIVSAIVLAAAVWMLRPSSPSPAAAGSAADRPSVAVMTFEVITGGPDVAWLAKGLPSMLLTGLAQTPELEVVGTERLSDAARQLGAASVDALDRSRMAELVRRAGARFVVNGAIVQAGADLRIDARVEDLTTGAVRFAESVRGTDALALADDLAARIRRGLDVQTAAPHKLAEVTSKSVDAYRAYTAAIEASQNVRTADADRLFAEAVRLDPTFALAHLGVADGAARAGDADARREALKRAAEHMDRLVERDQLIVHAEIAGAEERWDEADRILDVLMTRYPETESAYRSSAFMRSAYGPRPDLAAAIALHERGLRALPYSAALQNGYGYALLAQGRTEDALRAFETYVKLRPAEPNAIDSIGEGQLVAGDPTAAIDTFTRAFAAGHVPARAMRGWTYAITGRFDEALADMPPPPAPMLVRGLILSRAGRYRDAVRLIEETRRGLPAGNHVALTQTWLYDAWFMLERDQCGAISAAVTAADREARLVEGYRGRHLQVIADVFAGTCDARAGRLPEARARLAHARGIHAAGAPHERWWLAALEGEIALAAGDAAAADRAFASGEPERKMVFNRGTAMLATIVANNLVLRDGRARAAAAQGRVDEAIRLYRELLTTGPTQKWTAVLEPRYVLALARLLDKAGQREAARVEYRRFLEYWKNADADLPELAEARARAS